MSYRITIDGEPFCSSNFEHTQLLNPKVTLEVNKSGSLSFTMAPDHPYYDKISFRQSIFDVYLNDELIFEGIPVSEATDFWNRKTVTCEGELTFLNDTIQRQAVYKNKTVTTLLGEYLSVHNAQADATKQFTVGIVTVSGGNNIYRYTNYNTTMKELQEDLIQNFEGYFRVRHDGGVRYLDYLDSSPHTSSQTIRIGKNLADLSKNLSSLDICTVLIPLGAKTGTQLIDGLDERLTVKSVNNNLDYIVGTAQAYYGNIWRTQTWDDVTTAAALKTKAEAYLDDIQWANLVISATAFDLGLATEDVEQFHVLDMIRVVSEPHGIDRYFMLTKLDIDLDHPGNTKITLGKETRLSLSAKSAQTSAQVERQPTQIMVNASDSARMILDNATDGAIQILYNEDGVAYELRINNSQNPDTATKWWRYNSGGWGFTADGGQTYTAAATNDGTIFATLIKAGILSSDNGKFYVNLDTGAATLSDLTLTGGSINLGSGVFTVDNSGNVVANSLTSNNATITGGSINIQTQSQTVDKIQLNYTDSNNNAWSTKLNPQGLSASYTYSGGTQKSIIDNTGLLVVGASGSRLATNSSSLWVENSSNQELIGLSSTGLKFHNSSGDEIGFYKSTFKMLTGYGNAGQVSANSYTDYSVSFSSAFPSVPEVFPAFYSAYSGDAPANMNMCAYNITTNGFTLRVYNSNSTDQYAPFKWIAVTT